ncbi:hypothetical protein F4782DRAFT_543942 [Xylaria castorea]|nr:hypothetical protein F4782DRAFT_543942 [Xylaria castorea]
MATSVSNFKMQGIPNANKQVKDYLLERVPLFRQLTELREQGWQNPAGDQFFKNHYFFKLMKRIAQDLHSATDVFSIKTLDNVQPLILDWCMAPGGFLSAAIYHNRDARCRAFSLPPENGGHKVQLGSTARITVDLLDLNLLAADMGVDYCEHLESPRLTLVQLALGFEHIRSGGKMVILMHKIELWRCVWFLRVFSKFSTVRVFKPTRGYAKRSSYYLKQAWRAVTFDTEEAYKKLIQLPQAIVEEVLESFGPEFIKLATRVWEIQATALSHAQFIQTHSISSF